ncbi:anti-sigma factor [Burkholderia sp. Ac-20379]|uniref:anti-sigma factor n=1 Tax=Burkholderia sp. Ac-20379 TaxID=2703900 RepID=UPI00197DDA22|nr:anti-sigma factor [Burkholderia sp. Ac-20379]MBN3726066.1 anti-sigma factor [Burkholderia sp. Ac-20379]
MNTPAFSDDDLRCAEYALGVLDSDSRRQLERDVRKDAALRATLDAWLVRLAPLADELAVVQPPERVWTRIRRDLGFLPAGAGSDSVAEAAARGGWWNSLDLWRWLGIGASVAALGLLAVNLGVLREVAPGGASAPSGASGAAVEPTGYLVATLARTDGVAHWTATVDLRRGNMVVVPAVHPQLASGRSTELWLIPHGEKPIALGVFPADAPASMALPPKIVAQLVTTATLAVSVEPEGGSVTGQPTGPVIASGGLRVS